jgi:hypothetical protein
MIVVAGPPGSGKRAGTARKAERLLAARRTELAALDDEFFGEVVGVAQAIDALHAALKQVTAALDARQYEKASAKKFGNDPETRTMRPRRRRGRK